MSTIIVSEDVVPVVNLDIKKGMDWNMTLTVKDDNDTPQDLTDYSAKMQMRQKYNGDVLATLQTSGSGIAITGAEGLITIEFDHETTEAWNFSKALYDLYIESPAGSRQYLLEGIFTLNPRVTR